MPTNLQGMTHADNTVALTHFSDATELFVEFPAPGGRPGIAVSRPPHPSGRFQTGAAWGGDRRADRRWRARRAVRGRRRHVTAGIFRPLVRPGHAVQRRVILNIKGEELVANHDLGEFQVYPSAAEAEAALPTEAEPDDVVHYLKEQQWRVDFATAAAQGRELRASIQATGTLRPRADGEVYLSAASAGHLHSRGGFPHAGMPVEVGQVLASIIPRLGMDSDLSTLRAVLDKARSNHALASHERDRLKQLWSDKVIALHRLHEAESALEMAKADLDAAQRRYAQNTGEKPQDGSGIPVFAPISGVLAQVYGAPGKYVAEGEALFHIVNVDRLWLEARIAEADIGQLQQPDGAWFSSGRFQPNFQYLRVERATGGVGRGDRSSQPNGAADFCLRQSGSSTAHRHVRQCAGVYWRVPGSAWRCPVPRSSTMADRRWST